MSWTGSLESILADIVQAEISGNSRASISWAAVLREWKTRSTVAASKTQLKAKWQLLAPKSSTQQASGTGLPIASAALIGASSSSSSSSQSQHPASSSQSQHAAPSSGKPHCFSSANYNLAQIAAVIVPVAFKGQTFSELELQVFEYVLTDKLNWKIGDATIKWTTFATAWEQVVKVALLNNPAAIVAIRTKDQLEEKWKTTMKKKMTTPPTPPAAAAFFAAASVV